MRKLLALILPLLLLLIGIGTPFSYTCGICLPPCRAQENPQTAEESAESSQTDTLSLSAPSAILMEASTARFFMTRRVPWSWPPPASPKSCPCF